MGAHIRKDALGNCVVDPLKEQAVQTVFQGVFVADAAHLLAHFTSHFNILETIFLQLSQVLTDSTAWPSQSYTLTYYGSFTIYRV